MAITIDFHTHLLEKGVQPEVYWKAVKAKKLDAVAITEHFFEKPEKAYKMLLEKRPNGKLLIPGMELDTEIGHMIAFGKSPEIYGAKGLYKKRLALEDAIGIGVENGLVLAIAHPWGFSHDSAAYLLGEKRLKELVATKKIGVEAFNGMFGNVSSFFYATNWVRKPMNFFDFLEKSRFGRKTRLGKLGKKGREKLDKKGREILERCTKPYELAEKASFAVAGSDAHRTNRIGTGITKLEVKERSVAGILDAVQDKAKVRWLGPYVKETAKGYAVDKTSVQKTEVLSGLKYIAKRAIIKKVSRKKPNS